MRKRIFDFSILRRLFIFVSPYRTRFFLSVGFAVFLAIIAPLRPYLIQLTINHGIKENGVGHFIAGAGGFIIEMTIIQMALLLIESLVRFYFSFSTSALGQSVVRDLRNTTFQKILHLNLSQFDKTPIGTLTTRTINDIESVNDIFSDGLIPIIADLLSILSVLVYMFIIDWKLSLICLIPFPFLILATYFFKESVNKSFIKVRNAVAKLNSFVQEHLTGISLIQAFAAEKREQDKFSEINREHKNANVKSILAYSIFFPLVELISACSIGLMVWWAARQSIALPEQEAQKVAGIITSFILCLNLLFRPLRVIADKFNVLQMGMIAGERVFKVLDNDDVTPDQTNTDVSHEQTNKFKGDVEFKHVWFSYQPNQYVLKDISFQVPSGKTFALVGNTGSGKTSIVSLINRLYTHQKGIIQIDGIPVQSYPIEQLRSNISVVLQDVFLFSGTLLDNITLRNPHITYEQVVNAAKMIDMHDFIMRLPGGYRYDVMERGATLSMGQRQLISFLRALLYNPSILILDEATSSVDSETESLIQNAIDKVIFGRTSIVIAHRLSTIRKADIILVLDKGEIKEMGSHEELLQKKGHYFDLYHSQFFAEGNPNI
ncbi:MAG: ABC transporter ATP-binding protein [Ferruginibacter sp.]|nr:ABC transporter ATP-binding protein [Ferruginibacter sp.]